MNRRISKKQHKRYLLDLGIDICQDKDWQSRLAKMEIGQSIAIGGKATFFLFSPPNLKTLLVCRH
jgi:hypothetical protein